MLGADEGRADGQGDHIRAMTAIWRCGAIATALALAGCGTTGLAVSAGSATAVAANEERGLGGAISDTSIETQINALLLQHDFETFRKVGVKSYDRHVLLTGQVERPQMRLDAVRLAWRVRGVEEVINEIDVTDKGGAEAYARDVWISTQLRSCLLYTSDAADEL